jgi:hypothetical protein
MRRSCLSRAAPAAAICPPRSAEYGRQPVVDDTRPNSGPFRPTLPALRPVRLPSRGDDLLSALRGADQCSSWRSQANLDFIERTVESPAGTEKFPRLAAGQTAGPTSPDRPTRWCASDPPIRTTLAQHRRRQIGSTRWLLARSTLEAPGPVVRIGPSDLNHEV